MLQRYSSGRVLELRRYKGGKRVLAYVGYINYKMQGGRGVHKLLLHVNVVLGGNQGRGEE